MSIQRNLLVSLTLLSALFIARPSAAGELKVAVVDQRQGILTTEQGQQAQKELEKLADKRKAELKPAQDDFEAKQKELESQRLVLSQTALEERMLELEKQRRQLEREVQRVRDELQVQESKLLKPILEKWAAAVEALGKEKGFDVILDLSTPGILYHSSALDITELVTQRVNGTKKN
jgi:outer membrane protein